MRMGESKDSVDTSGVAVVRNAGNPLGNAGNAANGRQNPDFVTRADLSVRPAITEELCRFDALEGRLSRLELIAFHAAQQRFKIMRVDMAACLDPGQGPADGSAIFADWRVALDVRQCQLVAFRDRVAGANASVSEFDQLASRYVRKRDGNVVVGMHLDRQSGSGDGWIVRGCDHGKPVS